MNYEALMAELKQLRRENEELKQDNQTLRYALAEAIAEELMLGTIMKAAKATKHAN